MAQPILMHAWHGVDDALLHQFLCAELMRALLAEETKAQADSDGKSTAQKGLEAVGLGASGLLGRCSCCCNPHCMRLYLCNAASQTAQPPVPCRRCCSGCQGECQDQVGM